MNKAYEDTRSSTGEFIHALSNKVDGNRYLVKFMVEADGEVEHMWAEPVTFAEGIFKGKLINQPAKITSISVGALLEAPRDEISDWAILSPDDEFLEGGFTIKVMRSKEGKRPD